MDDRNPRAFEPDGDLRGAIHDANQLLAAIVARAGLLLHDPQIEDWRGHLKSIESAAQDAGALLLRAAGRAHPLFEDRTSLLEAVQVVSRLILPPGRQRWSADPQEPWSLVIEASESLCTTVPGLELRETLINLIRNAIEAAPEGIALRVTAIGGTDTHLLRILDNGPGVAADLVDRLLNEPVSGKGEGRGVGLHACRARLREMGADLRLVDTSDAGSTFEIRLPAAPDSSDDAATETSPGDAVRVLVVDDEATVREMLAEVLAEQGAEVVSVRNAEQARAAFDEGGADIVLVDRNLPGIGGDELARELRDRDQSVAIVLISGWESTSEAEKIDPACIDRYESKPLGWKRLQEIMRFGSALSRSRRGN